jgi:hypothetical protein
MWTSVQAITDSRTTCGSKYYAWVQTSAARQMKTVLFWVIGQRVVVITYRSFRTTYRSRIFLNPWRYGMSSDNFLPTFRDNLLVSFQGSRGIPDSWRWGMSTDNFSPTFPDNLLVSFQGVKRDSWRWGLSSVNFLPKFRENLSVPSSKVKGIRDPSRQDR